MDIERMTLSVQEALAGAQRIAEENQHTEIDLAHFLLALIDRPDSLMARIIERTGNQPARWLEFLRGELPKKPSIAGSGVKYGAYLTAALQSALNEAERLKEKWEDDYLSVEHIASILPGTTDYAINSFLQKEQLTQEKINEAIKEIRGNQKVTSQQPEAGYEALKK